MLYSLVVKPIRTVIPGYGSRPLASDVLAAYLEKRQFPSWTSYFIRYRDIQDNDYGRKHFNFSVKGHNYHVLRVGCYPYIKYHCTRRPYADLSFEDRFFRLITVANLGIPCALYGLAAIFLIRHRDDVVEPTTRQRVTLHFLIEEVHN
ncbi:unnamed protein product [Caenorhabditis auriculariae]|uniref:Uncharacterized protein n=1 Tax=Caenorhabditis auriculariae TaxID=2777116 RepID=A0A8S1HRL3_9PELO|nr:unnamed protein product [Caenorhabditis auriculariae]